MKHITAILLTVLLLSAAASCAADTREPDTTPTGESPAYKSPSTDVTESIPPDLSSQPSPSDELSDAEDEPATNTSERTTAGPTEQSPDSNMSDPEYTMMIGSLSLTLRQRDVEDDLASIQLPKISDTTEILGPDSDTFSGSVIRTVVYDGLTILLFAPKDDPGNYWIMQMTATGSAGDISSFRNVRVGDSVDTLKETYPELEENEEGGYIFTDKDQDLFDELTFDVSGGVVTRIRLTFYLP